MADYDPGLHQLGEPQAVEHLRYLLRQQRQNVADLEVTLRQIDGQPEPPRIVMIYP